MTKWVAVSYATRGAYENLSKRLFESAQKADVPMELRVIDTRGSWQANCLYKAVFIKEMLQKYHTAVLFVDADAVFHRYPELLDRIDADFAVHYFRGKQLASGTLYFNNTPGAQGLLDAWIQHNAEHPDLWDQTSLQYVVETLEWREKIRMEYLPGEYCKIFDLSGHIQNAVIEHFQASRSNKYPAMA